MEKQVKELDGSGNGWKTAQELNKVKRHYGGLPNEEDLQGAARALNRLQTVYRFVHFIRFTQYGNRLLFLKCTNL